MTDEAVRRWKIGDVTITWVVELEIPGAATWILPDATTENLAKVPWLKPHFVNEAGDPIMSVHALIIESEDQRILVDTCVGNDKKRPIPDWDLRQGPFLQDLADAGHPADSIDTVLCTHLHVDHVGWNTRLENGKRVPTFDNARYLWNRGEYDYWNAHPEQQMGDVMGDSVQPVLDAGRVDFVEPDHVVTSEVSLEPTPGHTPGHVSVHITSRGEEAVITGDLMHHPVQCAHPEWAASVDYDKDQARATRLAFLERYADRPVLILGTHFAGPSAGRVVRDGDAFRLDV